MNAQDKLKFNLETKFHAGDYKLLVYRNGLNMVNLTLKPIKELDMHEMRLHLGGGDDGVFDYKVYLEVGYSGHNLDTYEAIKLAENIRKQVKAMERLQDFIDAIEHN